MRAFIAALVAAYAAGAAAAADEPSDLRTLQGTWTATSLHRGDNAAPKDAKATLAVTGVRFTFTEPDGTHEGVLNLDPKKSPKAMDLVCKGKEARVIRCIYAFDGNTLTIAARHADRPADFEPRPGPTIVVSFKPDPGENMYREARAGDWVEYTGGDVVMRHTVASKKDDVLVLRIDQTVGGKAGPPIEQPIDLGRPYPPPDLPSTDVVVRREELERGKETLTIAGKPYACERVKARTTFTYKVEGKETTSSSVSTTWRCKDVPLGGAVRVVSELEGGKQSVSELSGHGRGK